jgi:hypothetical protein
MLKQCAYAALMLMGIGCGGSEEGSGCGVEPASISQGIQGDPPPSSGTWSFLPIAGMACADGSATGIGINLATRPSGKLLIYLEGGGGCWDVATCRNPVHVRNANLSGFDATTFQQVMVTGAPRYSPPLPPNHGAHGLWDRTTAANPFERYDYVYIPYCTADFHMGALPHSPADGLSHVGYVNMERALAYLSQRFTPSSTAKVVLSGSSAGGFGALWNFPQTQDAFGRIPVTLIAESGPPLPAPYLTPSLEEAWRVAWGLDGAKPAVAPSTHLFPYLRWAAQTYPDNRMGFIAVTGDVTLASFLDVWLVGENSLSNGLFALRQQLRQTSSNVDFFFVPGFVHQYLHQDPSTWPTTSPPFGSAKMSLSSWMRLQVE